MNVFNALWEKIKTHAIYIFIILVLMCALYASVSKCSSVSKEYKHNINALNDTIKF